ncbi:hypothetical protein BDB00DRAFT_867799 [Zychaea mexicana]|uniref:uncharacterized protein n=1 Tax=Zychaea mexicana TaxID=64656 RepID=UPI0022FECD8E|nr:uncharacterized protein BDB00DRAFT_867799 [Zychaea mexicana]KAI9498146.1 hypothetical protein BDB00DRAFT_867799 [Zychaea mexicana]
MLALEPISRKLTVNIEEDTPSVRPVVKGAMKEAAYTLTSAYASNEVLGWCARGLEQPKHDEFLYILFKNIIHAATLASRDFVIQVEGCAGVLIWSLQGSINTWVPSCLASMFKLARLTGWTSALRTYMKFQPSCDKARRKVMSCDHYLAINYLGVLPHERRKGFGRALLQHVLVKADEAHYPVYVEITDAGAVAFFAKFGFTIRGKVDSNSMPVILMVRDPVIRSDRPVSLQIGPGRRRSFT